MKTSNKITEKYLHHKIQIDKWLAASPTGKIRISRQMPLDDKIMEQYKNDGYVWKYLGYGDPDKYWDIPYFFSISRPQVTLSLVS